MHTTVTRLSIFHKTSNNKFNGINFIVGEARVADKLLVRSKRTSNIILININALNQIHNHKGCYIETLNKVKDRNKTKDTNACQP